jgi:hypothetical protein
MLTVDISMRKEWDKVAIKMVTASIPIGGIIIVIHENVGFPEGLAGSSNSNSPTG